MREASVSDFSGRGVRRAAAPALTALLLAVAGCKPSAPPPPPPTQTDEEPTIRPGIIVPNDEEEARSLELIAPDYPVEDPNDAALRAEPRLQFVWRHPKEKEITVWSARLDGTDIRRVVSPEVLFSGRAKELFHKPVRSPDRRYLACTGFDAKGDSLRMLVDLKEQKVRVIFPTGGAVPHFNWSPDSRTLYFQADFKFWEYDVPSGKLTERKTLFNQGLHLVDGGRRFVAIQERAVHVYDVEGKLLRTQPLPFKVSAYNAVSPDGRLLLLHSGINSLVIALDKPDAPLVRDDVFRPDAAFSPDGRQLYYSERGEAKVLELGSRQSHALAFPSRYSIGDLTYLAGQARP